MDSFLIGPEQIASLVGGIISKQRRPLARIAAHAMTLVTKTAIPPSVQGVVRKERHRRVEELEEHAIDGVMFIFFVRFIMV